jgi:hypothetical protein
MIKYGTFFRQSDGDTFIYIDDIHNKENITNIIDYMKRQHGMDYECIYNEDGSLIHFKCISFARESDNRRYSFCVGNDNYWLIEYTTHSIIFSVISSEEFSKYYFEVD